MALHGIHIKASHKGKLHEDLGVKKGEKLTNAELAKAKRSKNPAERKRATFAENARKWKKRGEKPEKSRAERMYGKED